MKNKLRKVAVALSGGVDSAVVAKLLVDRGFEVVGFHLRLCNEEGLKSAQAVATQLGISLEVIDLRDYFEREVIDPFVSAYQSGLTPNPCVICNRRVKFGRLLEIVKQKGFDRLATGHYAQVKKVADCWQLWSGEDEKKDQAYFLYRLDQDQLAKVIFPVGNWTKQKVRQFATKSNLVVQKRSESQDICFLAGDDYRKLVKSGPPGRIVSLQGELVGRHEGLSDYTIGQRKGFEMLADYKKRFEGSPPILYVVAKNLAQNELVVGEKNKLLKDVFGVSDLSWVGKTKPSELRWVKMRSGGERLKLAKVDWKNEVLRVKLENPIAGLAVGQHAVFYQKHLRGWEVLGGGVIAD